MAGISRRDCAWYANVCPTGLNALPFGMRERLTYPLPGRNIFTSEMGRRWREPCRSFSGYVERMKDLTSRDPREVWGRSTMIDFDHEADARENSIRVWAALWDDIPHADCYAGARLPTRARIGHVRKPRIGGITAVAERVPVLISNENETSDKVPENRRVESQHIGDVCNDEDDSEELVIVDLNASEAVNGLRSGWLRKVHAYCHLLVGRKVAPTCGQSYSSLVPSLGVDCSPEWLVREQRNSGADMPAYTQRL